MLVIVQNGGKQYSIESGKTIDCEKIDLEVGSPFTFQPNDILFAHDGSKLVEDMNSVVIACKVIKHDKGEKILSYKKQRRTSRFTKVRGHRQKFTSLLIESITVK